MSESGLPLAVSILFASVIISIWKAWKEVSSEIPAPMPKSSQQSDKPPSTFWQKLYSIPSLLFLAALAIAIWSTNLSSFYPSRPSALEVFERRKSAEEILGITPSPSPDIQSWLQQQRDEKVLTDLRREFPTTIISVVCKDGAYIYNVSGGAPCSPHGGVAYYPLGKP